ncbi:Chitin synthase export chaperone [Leucoagaricus sp. SymC.cos]|nr:Chitin synthase export chaperone [Leucoagaricus sp. SymC.cos]
MVQFGEFKDLCSQASSYALCNLFYLQLQREAPGVLGPSSQRPSAPVGINPECGIPKLHGTDGALSNIANNVLCGVGFLVTAALLWGCQKRIAAVGRVEFRALLSTYLVSLILQIVTGGALLEQGTQAIGALTAIHCGIVASLFWVLLWNAFTTTQLLDDGRVVSVMIMHGIQFAFFLVTLYISLDTAFGFTSAFGESSTPPDALRSVPLFVLTSIWPGAAVLISLGIISYVSLGILHERRPFWIYVGAIVVFIVAQVFRLSPVGTSICESSNQRVDGTFIATFLETVAIVVMYYGWADMTKGACVSFLRSCVPFD